MKKVLICLAVLITVALLLYNQQSISDKKNIQSSVLEKRLKNKEAELTDVKKDKVNNYLKYISCFMHSRLQEINENTKIELNKHIEKASRIASKTYKRYKTRKKIKNKIIENLKEINDENLYPTYFITDYSGNSILLGNQKADKENLVSYLDADYRSIILEEIQMVRKRSSGYICSTNSIVNNKEIVYVKDLGIYDWFVGASINIQKRENELKREILNLIKKLQIDKDEFISIYDGKVELYSSQREASTAKNVTYSFKVYDKVLDLKITYGFIRDKSPLF